MNHLPSNYTDWINLDLTDFKSLWFSLENKDLSRKIVPVNGAKSTPQFINSLLDAWRLGKIPLIHINSSVSKEDLKLGESQPNSRFVIGFMTSGTKSSLPKIVWKTWRQLHLEALCLATTFKYSETSKILSLVPPVHIFGFLFSVLTPSLASSQILFRENYFTSQPLDIPSVQVDIVVTSPPLWNTLLHELNHLLPKTILSSGSAMGTNRVQQSMELGRQFSVKIYDILGSTETGGIGYTEASSISLGMHLFPSVNLVQKSDVWSVISDFTDSVLMETADQFEVTEKSTLYKHLGRSDDVFKYGGKRLNLKEIENALKSSGLNSELVCHFFEDTLNAKGGTLTLFIEGTVTDLNHLRAQYLSSHSHLPFPSRVVFIDKFERSPSGKIPLSFLKRNYNPSSS